MLQFEKFKPTSKLQEFGGSEDIICSNTFIVIYPTNKLNFWVTSHFKALRETNSCFQIDVAFKKFDQTGNDKLNYRQNIHNINNIHKMHSK